MNVHFIQVINFEKKDLRWILEVSMMFKILKTFHKIQATARTFHRPKQRSVQAFKRNEHDKNSFLNFDNYTNDF